MKAVNLLPEGQRRRPVGQMLRGPLAALAIAGALGGVGFWGWSLNSQSADVRDQVAVTAADRDALNQEIAAYRVADGRFDTARLRRGAVIALASGRVNWERLIRDVSTVTPQDVWYVNVKAELDQSAGGSVAVDPNAVPKGLHLDGYAPSHGQVAVTMARVSAVRGLGEPRLTSSLMEDLEGQDVVHFIIDVPVDQRAQDRPTLTPTSATADVTGVSAP
ncbi:MAG: hypothetical protein QOD86_507 [Miltoncostaeaceae bacterium]|nr:hypothetical protein [Miltoncostaeaceae bacterium]